MEGLTPDRPGRLRLAPQVLEILAVLERVHAAPESVVRVDDELALGHQAIERLEYQILPLLEVFEDLLAEREETSVDADDRTPDRLEGGDVVAVVRPDDVEGVGRRNAQETRDLTLPGEACDVVVEVDVAEA